MLFLNPKWKVIGNSGVAGSSVTSWPATPLTLPPQKYLHIEGFIAGYTGGAIGRLRLGTTGGSVDTGNNYATAISEQNNNSQTLTQSVSIPGMPLGATAITGPRFFSLDMYNVSSVVKRIIGRADASSVSAATSPLSINVCGIWVNTSAQALGMDIASYTNLTNTTTGNQFTSGTEFAVWGKDEA